MKVHRKVTGSVLGVAIATVLVYSLEATLGIDIPTAVEDSVQVLCTFAGGFLTSE